ncbi:MAG: response regulator [Methanomicrobium sp.]|nr:response regulator [Methanomicrobium sp.]
MLHILIVDEEAEVLEVTSVYLKRIGDYTIEKAYSAKDALSLIRKKAYDAIVSDYEMPEMDGITFLKEVRRINPSVPFIIFSGKGREEVVIEAFREGADGFVQKGKDLKSQFAELNHQIETASRKRFAECELRMKEYAIEVSFNGILIFDDNNRISYANSASQKLHGYNSKDEITGRNISDIFDFSDEGNKDDDFFRSLKDNGIFFGEVKGLKIDGSRFDAQLSAIRLSNPVTGERYNFGSYIDITEKKLAEKALLEFITEAAKRLKEPVNHISRSLFETVELLDSKKEPEMIKMKISVQIKNAEQVIINLNELNTAISKGFGSIPDNFREYLIR